MSTTRGKVVDCDRHDARVRLTQADAYLTVADLAIEEHGEEWATVAAGVAVIAGIAAADAICCLRTGRRFRGQDHRQAAELLEGALPDGRKLADGFRRLLDVKDQSHYGLRLVSRQQARAAIRRARTLVERARTELQR